MDGEEEDDLSEDLSGFPLDKRMSGEDVVRLTTGLTIGRPPIEPLLLLLAITVGAGEKGAGEAVVIVGEGNPGPGDAVRGNGIPGLTRCGSVGRGRLTVRFMCIDDRGLSLTAIGAPRSSSSSVLCKLTVGSSSETLLLSSLKWNTDLLGVAGGVRRGSDPKEEKAPRPDRPLVLGDEK